MMNTEGMNTQKNTPKIVVGVALAVAAAIGISVFSVTAHHEQVAKNSAPAVAQPAVPDALAPSTDAPDQSAVTPNATPAPAEQPAMPAPSTLASSAPSASVAAANTPAAPEAQDSAKVVKPKTDHHVARARNHGEGDESTARSGDNAVVAAVAPTPSGNNASAVASASNGDAAPSGDAATAAPAASATDAPSTDATMTASTAQPAVSDTQITAQVRSEVATAAPDSKVEVRTTDGDVALAGSVTSQDAADQARQAALKVAGVKHVDASGLTVSIQ